MADVKITFAQNLISLRKQMKLTQIELAEKLNYSDKAVSKWERGESIPDVTVLMDIAKTFGVTHILIYNALFANTSERLSVARLVVYLYSLPPFKKVYGVIL